MKIKVMNNLSQNRLKFVRTLRNGVKWGNERKRKSITRKFIKRFF